MESKEQQTCVIEVDGCRTCPMEFPGNECSAMDGRATRRYLETIMPDWCPLKDGGVVVVKAVER